MNLNDIAQACLERNHCRFFSSLSFYLFSCNWCRKWKMENGKIPRTKRLTCLVVVLQYYWIML